jgi:hypothetical protein
LDIEQGYEAEINQLFANQNIHKLIDADFTERCQNLLQPAWQVQ